MNKLLYILLGVVIAGSGTLVIASQHLGTSTIYSGNPIYPEVMKDNFDYLHSCVLRPTEVCMGTDYLQWDGNQFNCIRN